MVDRVQGKYCKQDPNGAIFAFRKDTGAKYVYHVHNPFTGEPTAAQVAAKNKFASVAAQVKGILADVQQSAQYREAFAKQSKYKTLRGYIFAELMAA